nr:MAG TPA: hypothetical protein [Caudoviricetes sp.]
MIFVISVLISLKFGAVPPLTFNFEASIPFKVSLSIIGIVNPGYNVSTFSKLLFTLRFIIFKILIVKGSQQ